MFFYPFLPLLNRDHNSDSMVYINCASIARIKAENNSLNTRFSRRYIFLIANIILSSTDGKDNGRERWGRGIVYKDGKLHSEESPILYQSTRRSSNKDPRIRPSLPSDLLFLFQVTDKSKLLLVS
jgi:hypothetical protein